MTTAHPSAFAGEPAKAEVTPLAATVVPHEGGGRRGARMNADPERPEQLSQINHWEVIHDEER
ncbi:hypothetical protein E1267_17385 [Nonomuraea longispora]|uniref:Uncharacterized protein n=1 Tax=Nonomuraea longispora TaxID=1848320 RepID=A0A4R4NGY8_9ACTN|nr:hypothetical protein [Nonomuraea longispora]TDC06092.1 hypothetical protein E1267_17385 [Nonomuraea longispora]